MEYAQKTNARIILARMVELVAPTEAVITEIALAPPTAMESTVKNAHVDLTFA